jgi:hypothetical protein
MVRSLEYDRCARSDNRQSSPVIAQLVVLSVLTAPATSQAGCTDDSSPRIDAFEIEVEVEVKVKSLQRLLGIPGLEIAVV